MISRDEAIADAAELASLLTRLGIKYGDKLEFLADDPYCSWDTAGFLPKPPTGEARLVRDSFEVLVEQHKGFWRVITDDN